MGEMGPFKSYIVGASPPHPSFFLGAGPPDPLPVVNISVVPNGRAKGPIGCIIGSLSSLYKPKK